MYAELKCINFLLHTTTLKQQYRDLKASLRWTLTYALLFPLL